MKYLLSLWCDENFGVIQCNGTIYGEAGELERMEVWTPERQSLAYCIHEIAERIARAGVQTSFDLESLD